MRDARVPDPADVVVAWEAVEELLAPVPEGAGRDVLRLVAAGLSHERIAERLTLPLAEVERLTAHGRIRLLTAAIVADANPQAPRGRPDRAGA